MTADKVFYLTTIHGQMGSSDDFDQLIIEVDQLLNQEKYSHLQIKWQHISLFDSDEIKIDSFESVSKSIFQNLNNLRKMPYHAIKILIGYSLGARIGMQLLFDDPNFFNHCFFISGHSGLENEILKNERLASDHLWAEKIRELNWTDFIKEWNQQDVLKNSNSFNKKYQPSDQQKNKYINAFKNLSLGRQSSKNKLLETYSSKYTWIVGEKDHKFCDLAENLRQKKILSGYERILESGHRILTDQPSKLAEIILKKLI